MSETGQQFAGNRDPTNSDKKEGFWRWAWWILAATQFLCIVGATSCCIVYNWIWFSRISNFYSTEGYTWHLSILALALALTGMFVPGIVPCILGFVVHWATSGSKDEVDGCYEKILNYAKADHAFGSFMKVHCEDTDCYHEYCASPRTWNMTLSIVFVISILLGWIKKAIKTYRPDKTKNNHEKTVE